jgi:polysaccharide pyruvyl transferase WcaK-like protein
MDPAQAAADLGSVDLLVSMRLHASILGHRQGVPAVGLNYEAKISDYFHEIGEGDRVIGPEASADQLYSVMATTLLHRAEVKERLRPVIGAMESIARRRLDENVQTLLDLATPGTTDLWSLTAGELS